METPSGSTRMHMVGPPRSVRPLIMSWFRRHAEVTCPLLEPTAWERVGGVMAWRGVWHGSIGAMAGMLVAGCTQTSRVDDNLSTAALAETKKAVAVMRVGAASPYCVNVAVLLGVRDGEGFRRHQGITVMNVRSLDRAGGGGDRAGARRVPHRCLSLPNQGRHQDGGRRRRARHLRHQLCQLPAGAGRGRQRRLPARRGLAPRPQHVRPADAEWTWR